MDTLVIRKSTLEGKWDVHLNDAYLTSATGIPGKIAEDLAAKFPDAYIGIQLSETVFPGLHRWCQSAGWGSFLWFGEHKPAVKREALEALVRIMGYEEGAEDDQAA